MTVLAPSGTPDQRRIRIIWSIAVMFSVRSAMIQMQVLKRCALHLKSLGARCRRFLATSSECALKVARRIVLFAHFCSFRAVIVDRQCLSHRHILQSGRPPLKTIDPLLWHDVPTPKRRVIVLDRCSKAARLAGNRSHALAGLRQRSLACERFPAFRVSAMMSPNLAAVNVGVTEVPRM